ncbi:MAG: HNH endonuclease [Thaumarchaeota archaeon]|nr:HNH endonuclease [Nitrososphaerota archaeon]
MIDKINIPIVQSCNWVLTGWGYIMGSGKYRHQYLHIIIARQAGLDISDQIDHKDGNIYNNLISNLRPTTHAQNQMNSKIPSNNTSGHKGVDYDKNVQKYRARLDGKFLGLFDTAKEASAVRWEAAKKLHKDFARFE